VLGDVDFFSSEVGQADVAYFVVGHIVFVLNLG
jgi:hypothetical protein